MDVHQAWNVQCQRVLHHFTITLGILVSLTGGVQEPIKLRGAGASFPSSVYFRWIPQYEVC